jgi:predicted dithiol-disulfide oxidoreductase (DUF899 family)
MNYVEGGQRLSGLRARIAALRQEMRQVQDSVTPQPVADYTFATPDGRVSLSSLFGAHDSLFVVHNMGAGCSYCTLWADGYNGVYRQLSARAAFVVSSPDDPESQRRLARARGWQFPMVSHQGTSFAADMGYVDADGHCTPGISVFQRRDGRIVRVSDAGAEPLDDFCVAWHLLALLPGGAADWRPDRSLPVAGDGSAACCSGADVRAAGG